MPIGGWLGGSNIRSALRRRPARLMPSECHPSGGQIVGDRAPRFARGKTDLQSLVTTPGLVGSPARPEYEARASDDLEPAVRIDPAISCSSLDQPGLRSTRGPLPFATREPVPTPVRDSQWMPIRVPIQMPAPEYLQIVTAAVVGRLIPVLEPDSARVG